MTLDKLTPEDWAALASVPEGATKVSGLDEATHERLDQTGITHPFDTRLTSFGRGVIAAARVLVGREPDMREREARRVLEAEVQRLRERIEDLEHEAIAAASGAWAAIAAD